MATAGAVAASRIKTPVVHVIFIMWLKRKLNVVDEKPGALGIRAFRISLPVGPKRCGLATKR